MQKIVWMMLGVGVVLSPAASGVDPEKVNQRAPENELVAKLSSPISTKRSRRNDSIVAQVIAPPGLVNAIVEGHIQEAAPAHKHSKAEISFGFDRLIAGGQSYSMTKVDLIRIVNSRGEADADEKGQIVGVRSKKKRVIGTVAGGGIGALIGAIAGGGSGAIAGGAAGATAGFLLTYSLLTDGSDLEFAPGSELHFRLPETNRSR